jgi:hypothetical protein
MLANWARVRGAGAGPSSDGVIEERWSPRPPREKRGEPVDGHEEPRAKKRRNSSSEPEPEPRRQEVPRVTVTATEDEASTPTVVAAPAITASDGNKSEEEWNGIKD